MANDVAGLALDRRVAAQKLDAVAWGLFFLWVGIALIADFGWGVGALGVGILILGGQAARRFMALRFETFWAVIGTLFILCGIWELFNVRVSLIALLCIAAGVTLLLSALVGKPKG